jgi:hypothetical protein
MTLSDNEILQIVLTSLQYNPATVIAGVLESESYRNMSRTDQELFWTSFAKYATLSGSHGMLLVCGMHMILPTDVMKTVQANLNQELNQQL